MYGKKQEVIPESCKKCDLAQTRTKIVNSSGSEHPDYLFVGEAPGEDEDLSGKPFVGKAGKVLRWIIDKAGIKKVRLDNLVHCRPTENYYKYGVLHYRNREPSKEEICCCQEYLIEEINRVKPKIIIPVGKTAISFFLNKEQSKFSLTDVISARYNWNGYPVLPTWHPSWILRGNISAIEDVIDTINYGKALIDARVKNSELFIIDSTRRFNLLYKKLNEVDFFAADLETSKSGEIIGISFSWQEDTGVYLPLKIYDGFKLNDFWSNSRDIINGLSETIKIKYSNIVWHNAKYDTRVLFEKCGIPIAACHDTSLMWGVLNDTKMDGSKRRVGLAFLTRKFFPWYKDYKRAVTDSFTKEEDVDYSLLPLAVIAPYGAMDSLVTLKLFFLFYKMLYGKEFNETY